MRQGFLIGAIILWVGINIIGSFIQMDAPLSGYDDELEMTDVEIMNAAAKPDITDFNLVTMFQKIGDYIVIIGKFLALWHPSLWQGIGLQLYFFLFLPIGISFWVVLVLSLRGVGSN